jgi:hypothetical protein
MKRKKRITFIVLILLLLCRIEAQNLPSFYPFKGFHIGLSGQAQFIQKCTFTALTGTDPAPRPKWSYGWEAGIEFSYHFAKYFGITMCINYGTTYYFDYDIYLSTVPDGIGGWKEVNAYEPTFFSLLHFHEQIMFPVKLEFHYSLHKNIFFVAEAGVKVKGIFQKLAYGGKNYFVYKNYNFGYIIWPSDTPDEYEMIDYFDRYGWENVSKIRCNLLLGIGLSYKLPYGDLLRFTAGVNLSFEPIIEGYYVYHLTDSYGTFSVKNDFLYTQLSYIHTFNFLKAKKYLKKQEYSFSSKKERRQRIFEMLEVW